MPSEGKNLIGVDIGSSSIKVCEIKEGRRGARTITRFGFHPLPAETIVDGHIINSGAVVEGLERIVVSCVLEGPSQHGVGQPRIDHTLEEVVGEGGVALRGE